MKYYRFILQIAILLLIAGACESRKDTSMSLQDESVIAKTPSIGSGKWNMMKGHISIDTVNLYGGKNSLRLTSSEKDSLKEIYVFYGYDLTELDARFLTIKGKYKIDKAEDAEIIFRIQQYYYIDRVDSIIIEPIKTSEWKDFTVKTPIEKEANWAALYIVGKGEIDILVSDCQAWIDDIPLSDILNKEYAAEKDIEFDKGSGIELGELTPQMLENLEVLGKVWGFLKYYHPEVTQGKYNWDYELFRVLSPIVKAKNKEERNELINKWIDKYGKIEEVVDYTISDSTKYSRFIDLSWLENKALFNSDVINKLRNIKSSYRSEKLNYYISSYPSHSSAPCFDREKVYGNITWSDEGFRILTLFRIWNAIEYCFPYTHFTNTPWETVLKDFLPKFVSPINQESYELAILELGSKIDDSHGYIQINDNPMYKKNRVPVELTQSAEGFIVVRSSGSEFFHRGDIIVSIEGRDVYDIIEEMSSYVIASNRNGLVRNILPYLMSTNSNQHNVEVIRDGKRIEVHVKNFIRQFRSSRVKSWENYDLTSKNIIHVDNIKTADENMTIVQNNMDSKGLIIDMRNYPYYDNMKYLPPLILSKYPLWISENDRSHPGNYHVKFGYDKVNEPEKEPNYKGRIVILVDENTQSAGETGAMMYRIAPNSMIVGRQTAGANGNIGKLCLPGGIMFQYTWNGAYYPYWEILQRKGVKIDFLVSPTVDDIKAGRDVWIEKAIEIIENKIEI